MYRHLGIDELEREQEVFNRQDEVIKTLILCPSVLHTKNHNQPDEGDRTD